MLSKDEINYIKKIPNSKKFFYYKFDTETVNIFQSIKKQIGNLFPNVRVIQLGASALQIGGQNDIDIYILVEELYFKDYLDGLVSIFGNPSSMNKKSIAWEFYKNNLSVELYLTDPTSGSMMRQIKVFRILDENENLKKEYDELKLNLSGKSFKEYQQQKYLFYHKVLDN